MMTLKAIFKKEFFRVRAIVRAMSDETLRFHDEESYEYALPTHYYRYVRKEITLRGIADIELIEPDMPEDSFDFEVYGETLGDILTRALAA